MHSYVGLKKLLLGVDRRWQVWEAVLASCLRKAQHLEPQQDDGSAA